MRKQIFLAALLIFTLPAWGNGKTILMPVNEAGDFEYSGTVELEGETADELYSRAKAWVAMAYVSAQDVIQLDDRDAHRLIMKGNTSTHWMLTETATVGHVLTIETKDGKYRYSLGSFTISSSAAGGRGPLTGRTHKVVNRTHLQVSDILTSLWEAMEVESGDDW